MASDYKLKDSFAVLKGIMKEANLLNELDCIIEEKCPDEFDFWCSPLLLRSQLSTPSEEALLSILAKESSNPVIGKALNSDALMSYFHKLTREEQTEPNSFWTLPVLRILSNLSQHSHGRELIMQSKFLPSWIEKQSEVETPSLFLEAWKVLHNLNVDEGIYLDRLYPMQPPLKKEEIPEVDVVLIHGIKGGAAWTWRQHDSQKSKRVIDQSTRKKILSNQSDGILDEVYTWLWPLDWLAPSLKVPVRLISVDYPAYWWNWSAGKFISSDYSIDELCEDILANLKIAGVGSRPIIWITHSMGGLVLKNIFKLQYKEFLKERELDRQLIGSTRGVIFLSVPHLGTPLATWSCRLSTLLRPSAFVRYMRADLPHLKQLNEEFVNLCDKNIKVLTINERLPSQISKNGPSFVFIPKNYGDPGIGEIHEVDVTHLDICKPYDRSSQIYKLIKNFIDEILKSGSL